MGWFFCSLSAPRAGTASRRPDCSVGFLKRLATSLLNIQSATRVRYPKYPMTWASDGLAVYPNRASNVAPNSLPSLITALVSHRPLPKAGMTPTSWNSPTPCATRPAAKSTKSAPVTLKKVRRLNLTEYFTITTATTAAIPRPMSPPISMSQPEAETDADPRNITVSTPSLKMLTNASAAKPQACLPVTAPSTCRLRDSE